MLQKQTLANHPPSHFPTYRFRLSGADGSLTAHFQDLDIPIGPRFGQFGEAVFCF
jgi:hypothetical protein